MRKFHPHTEPRQNGTCDEYFVVGAHWRGGPYTTQLMASEIRRVLADVIPTITFRITSNAS